MLASSVISFSNFALFLLICFLTLSGTYSIVMYSTMGHFFKMKSLESGGSFTGSFGFVVTSVFVILPMFGMSFQCLLSF